MPLYHYSCPHGDRAIRADGGILRPAIAVATPGQRRTLRDNPFTARIGQVVWLTTMPGLTWINRQAAGLGMDNSVLAPTTRRRSPNPPRICDRTAYRWEVTEEDVPIEPWEDVRVFWPRWLVISLEGLPGVRPETWWVSRGPLRARFSPNHATPSAPAHEAAPA